MFKMAAKKVGKDVFVSYGREESVKEFVRKLKKDLETEQLSVWLDVEDIPTGTEWPKEIAVALGECKALIAVVTRRYVSSDYCKSELCVARGNKKPVFPLIREDGWDESDNGKGVHFMIAASNWAMFRPVDDYGESLQRLVEGLRGMEAGTEQDPLDSLTGQPRSPSTEPPNQTLAEPTPPTASLDEPRPEPAAPANSCPTAARKGDTNTLPKEKKCTIGLNCRRFVTLILKLSSILSRDRESDALVLGRMKLALATLKGQDESVGVDPVVYHGTKTVQEFFEVMSTYWNCYADHDLLIMVIEVTENKEAIDALHCFLKTRDPGMVVPLVRCPDVPFRPACSGNEQGRRLGTAAEIMKEENGEGVSPQQIAGRNAIVLEANQRKVCSISQKKPSDIPESSQDDLPAEQKEKPALLQMEGRSALILEANQKRVCSISQKKACELPKASQDEFCPEQKTTSETDPSQLADTDTTNSTTPADTAQQNGNGDEFMESLLAQETITRQRSSSSDLIISQQPQLMPPELELSEHWQSLHHHPDRSHELPPGRIPLVVEVGLDHMTCGMYDCLKDVVASVCRTPRAAMSLLGAFKGSCILVWHVSEEIAAGIKRIQLSPDDQEMLLQCAVMKMSCGEDCLFNISEDELEEMVASGVIPELAETVSEEGEEMGRVRAITSDEEFERELKQAGESLVVVDFTADWCLWSVLMNPKFAELSEQYTEAEFLSVDTEECEDTAAKYDVNAVPMFAFFRMGKLLHKFSGANPDELEAKLKHFLEGSGAFFPGKGRSLLPKEDPDTKDVTQTAEREAISGRGETGRERMREGGETEREGEKEERQDSGEEGEREEAVGRTEGSKKEEGAKVEEKGGGSEDQPRHPPPVTVDPSLPTTSVQIRLADGSRLIGKFNHSHTIGDIHRLISDSQPSLAAASYVLMTTFPRKELTDDTQTLADANLLNAVIRQKLT